MDYYIRRGSKITGPIDQEALHARAGRGEVVATDELSHGENGPWQMAGTQKWLTLRSATPSQSHVRRLRKWLALSAIGNVLLIAISAYAFCRDPRITLNRGDGSTFTVVADEELRRLLSAEVQQAREWAERAAEMQMKQREHDSP